MNEKTAVERGLRRAGALAVAAAVAVLVTACGGGGAPSSASPPTYVQVLALAQCMRGHGVPSFPDPDAAGSYTLTSNGSIEGAGGSSVDINSSQAQAAYGHCRHLLPGGPSISQLEQKQQQEQQQQEKALPALLKWEQCVRSHGVPNFNLGLGGQSPAPGNSGAFNPNSPQFQAAQRACRHLLPPGVSLHVSAQTHAPAP
jgi:hypothetical protein